jgi:hypothetical protein
MNSTPESFELHISYNIYPSTLKTITRSLGHDCARTYRIVCAGDWTQFTRGEGEIGPRLEVLVSTTETFMW